MDELRQLYIYRESCAMEAFNLSSVKDFAMKLIPNIASTFSSFLSKFRAGDSIKLSRDEKKLITFALKHDYVNLREFELIVPEGFVGKYIEYSQELTKSVGFLTNLISSLQEYRNYLARMITNREVIKSIDYDASDCNIFLEQIDGFNRGIAPFFKKNSTNAKRKYKDLLDRNADWEDIFTLNKKMLQDIESINRNDLMKYIKEISSLLDTLMKAIKSDGIEGISNETVAQIGDSTYALAKYLEFYSVTYYRLKAHTECINTSVGMILKLD